MEIICPCTIEGIKATMVVDSGSDVTCLSTRGAKTLQLEIHAEQRTLLPCGNGNKVESQGYVIIEEFRLGRKLVKDLKVPVCNIEESCEPAMGIIGLNDFSKFGFSVEGVPHNYPPTTREEEKEEDELDEADGLPSSYQAPAELRQQLLKEVREVLTYNKNIPEDTFCTHPSAVVSLHTGEAEPVYVPQYMVSNFMTSHIDRQVAKWESNGVVVDAPPNSKWNNPILGVQSRADRAKGKDPRVCIDPRKLNLLLKSDPRPIPNIKGIYERLKGFKYITELDLRKGFNQFEIRECDRMKTTFTWRGKKRMFRGSPFGLKPLSQLFQGVIEEILSEDREYATPFIDNIYIHSDGSMEDHARKVRRIIELLNKYNLRLNLDKCNFGYTAVNVLGHFLSGDTRRLDPAKMSAVQKWPEPRTGKEIERFLGFTNYLRDFIPMYAELAAPMEKLRKFKVLGAAWDVNCQVSFDTMKRVLTKAPVLSTPLPDVEFQVQTDASQFGIGWVLYQVDPDTGAMRYILFGAKALQGGQVSYGATRRELLAIVEALKACRQWLYGNHFRLYTDHQCLTSLYTQKHMNYMMLNWIDILLDYDFTVVHRPGVDMILPDALSRMFNHLREERFKNNFAKRQEPGEGKCGLRIRGLTSEELSKYPDTELKDFIANRFCKKFIPTDDRAKLLDEYHKQGHFGAEVLFRTLWRDAGVYWPGMRLDCRKLVGTCLQCLRYNVGKTGYHPMKSIDAQLPFEHIAIDTLSGFKTTSRGNNYILVITDMCTRYKLLRAQKTKSAEETAWSLWNVCCNYPTPKIIQSDNGTEFCNQVVQQMLQLTGVDHRRIAAYNPRANGTAENAVGISQNVLRKIANGLTDWDLHLPAVQLALNAKPNASTKCSPASLVFGVNINAFANYDRSASRLLTTHQLLERWRVVQNLIRPQASINFKGKQSKRVASANAKLRQTKPIPVSAMVMLKDPTRSTKHDPYWIGPFRVLKQKRGGNYVLQNPDHSLYHREPPRHHLKVIDGKVDLSDIFYVERILDSKGPVSKKKYLIKWLNYPSSHNTWEPYENLIGCEKLLEEFNSSQASAQEIKSTD